MTKEEYDRIYEVKLLETDLLYMLHALGLRPKNAYTRLATRNYFFGDVDYLKHLVEVGMMKEISKDKFVVTKAGVLKLQEWLDQVIEFKDWEDVYE